MYDCRNPLIQLNYLPWNFPKSEMDGNFRARGCKLNQAKPVEMQPKRTGYRGRKNHPSSATSQRVHWERGREKGTYLELAKSESLPVLEKIMTPTSASQRIASSFAFFSRPFRLFENVTCLLVESSIFSIAIFPLPIVPPHLTTNLHTQRYIYIYIH